MNTPTRDLHLWTLAQSRAKFKSQLLTFVLVNALLWAVWYVSGHRGHAWPLLVMLFWGVGLTLKGLAAYSVWPVAGWTEREYEQLQRSQGPQQR
ncbi:hypothetical protein GCM10027048_25020 [Hymenobacter coalescens]